MRWGATAASARERPAIDVEITDDGVAALRTEAISITLDLAVR
jgi:hypothetical protein